MKASALIQTIQRAIGAFGDLDVRVAWEGQLKKTDHEHTVHFTPDNEGGSNGFIVLDGDEGGAFNGAHDRPVPGHYPVTVRLSSQAVSSLVMGKGWDIVDTNSKLPHLRFIPPGYVSLPIGSTAAVIVPLSAAEIGLLQRGGDVWYSPLRLLIVGVYLDGVI